MPAIMETEVIETNRGYACDMCGTKISDGGNDGCGGVNWWGVHLDLDSMEQESVVATRKLDGFHLRVRQPWTGNISEHWGLCRDCVERVRVFITNGANEGNR